VKRRLALKSTSEFEKYSDLAAMKAGEMNPDLYGTPMVLFRQHVGVDDDRRHVFARFAAHGFHGELCETAGYHPPEDSCRCRLCGGRSTEYHLIECTHNRKSLQEVAEGIDIGLNPQG
jgi:hypothetical protein